MRTIIIAVIMLMLISTGCSASNSVQPEISTSNPPTQAVSSSSANTGSLFSINEIGLGSDGYVALTNFTDQPASLAGLFLCQGAKCSELPDVNVASGKTVRVAVGDGGGLEDVVATKVSIGELRPPNGEVALYTSQNVIDPKAILAYLEWGSTPHEDTQVAIDAGLWIKGSYAPSSDKATHLFRTEGGLWLFDE